MNREYNAPVAIVISFDMSDVISTSAIRGEDVDFDDTDHNIGAE